MYTIFLIHHFLNGFFYASVHYSKNVILATLIKYDVLLGQAILSGNMSQNCRTRISI